MSKAPPLDRRRFLAKAGTGLGALMLAGCDRLSNSDPFKDNVLRLAEDANLRIQRWLLASDRLAPEFTEAEIAPAFKANGSLKPNDPAYDKLAKGGFAQWRLEVGGLVERPTRLSLAQLRAMPSRTQITRHDCVEGWSCIGKWTGVPLGEILKQVGLKPQARYVVFHCADTMGAEGADDDDAGDESASDESGKGTETAAQQAADNGQDSSAKYYESIDLDDAFHPQTILAHEMNGKPLPIPHGAPIRLRVERQLGYKMAKFIMRIEVVDSFASIGAGRGGYWEDRGYDWFAGI